VLNVFNFSSVSSYSGILFLLPHIVFHNGTLPRFPRFNYNEVYSHEVYRYTVLLSLVFFNILDILGMGAPMVSTV